MANNRDYLKIEQQAGPVTTTPELDLSLDDDELIDLISRKMEEYRGMMDSGTAKGVDISVTNRAEQNVRYWRGTQEQDKRVGRSTKRYRNNIIHRDLATRVQNATSRMPDIVVMSPQQDEDPSVKDQTKSVEEWLSIRVDSDVTRRIMQSAVRDNHLKFIGIIALRYDKDRKDAIIERLRPEDVILDATARVPEDGYTTDNMEFIGEWCEDYTQHVFSLFPGKKEELLDEISREQHQGKPKSSKIRYLKSTARVTKKDGSPTIILIYSYNSILLSKGPHPYWDDREGSEEQFGVIPDNELHPEIAAMLPSLGLSLPQKKAKRFNHFAWPRMPYVLLSGENLGNGPLDDTTVVEQSLPLQDIVNERGDQITQINDWAIPKLITSTETMTSEKTNNITGDASEIVTLKLKEGQSVGDVFDTISGEAASPALYQDLQQAIQGIDSHFSTSAAVRGEAVEPESGVSKQISREGDLSASDDIAQTMVQRAVEEIANWLVQLAKIYFDEPKQAIAPGSDRTMRTASISSSLIPDDIQIVVKANAVDKMTQRNMSMNLVTSKGIDPMSLYEDLEFPNPKERTQRLVDFLNGAPNGYVKYLQDIGVNAGEPANEQNEATDTSQPSPGQPGTPPGPPQPIQAPPMPQPSVPPASPSLVGSPPPPV